MRSPERSCMRCAAARWRRCARCRSRNITAASMRRRCSCCWPDFTSNAPATIETLEELWPAIEAALRWIDGPGDPDGDGFVEYQRATEAGLAQSGLEGFLRRDLPCRRHGWPKAISRSPRCRATSLPPSGWRRAVRARLGLARDRARELEVEAQRLRPAVRGGVLVRGSRHLRAGARRQETALPGAHVECRAVCSSPASSARTARAGSPPT